MSKVSVQHLTVGGNEQDHRPANFQSLYVAMAKLEITYVKSDLFRVEIKQNDYPEATCRVFIWRDGWRFVRSYYEGTSGIPYSNGKFCMPNDWSVIKEAMELLILDTAKLFDYPHPEGD